MSLLPGTYPQVAHHIPGIDLSKFGVPTTQYRPPTAVQNESCLSQPSFAPAPKYGQELFVKQDFGSEIVTSFQKDAQDLRQVNAAQAGQIIELRQVNASQADQIIDLKIRNAVLENDLNHAVKDKENVVSTIGIVIQSITRGTSVTPTPQAVSVPDSNYFTSSSDSKIIAQNKEIERYRKAERSLRARISDLERDHEIRGRARERENDDGSMGRDHKFLRQSGWGENAHTIDSVIPPPKHHPGFAQAKKLSGPAASELMGSWAMDDASHSPTRRNSPIVKPVHDPAAADVGMCSLEDFLENNGLPAVVSTPSPTAQATRPSLFDVDRPIDEQIADFIKADAQFLNMPKPNVLKVGFRSEGAHRGADYDNMKPPEPLPPLRKRTDWQRPPPGAPNGPRGYRREEELPDYLKEAAFDRNGGLWNNFDDKNDAVKNHMRAAGRREARQVELFKYGIQYTPTEMDSNYFRTIHISNLPLGTDARDVLARIRGGDVLNVAVLNMGKIASDSVQARVVFKDEAAAMAYLSYVEKNPISFSAGDDGEPKVVEIALIETPTYPIAFRLARALSQQTRCIAVRRIPSSFSLNALEHNLACGSRWRAEGLVEMFIDEEGVLHLEFSSVSIAGGAWSILTTFNYYRGLECRWEKDPCSGDVEELAEGVIPRRPTYPANWNMLQPGEGIAAESTQAEGRKPLAALSKQKVDIPIFSGAKLQSSSWADEVNGELSETEVSPGPRGSSGQETGSSFSEPVESSNADTNSPISTTDATDVSKSGSTSSPTTVDADLSLLRAPNTNQLLAATTSKVESSTQDLPKPLVGLAGSKYASSVPSVTDISPPHRPTQAPTLGAGFAIASKLSYSPPRVNLSHLIASPPVSPPLGSQPSPIKKTTHHHIPEELSATGPDTTAAIAENTKVVTPPPQPQLFQWFQVASSNKKKRGYAATAQEAEAPTSRRITAESRAPDDVEGKEGGEDLVFIVSNPDEISLDDDDDNVKEQKEPGDEVSHGMDPLVKSAAGIKAGVLAHAPRGDEQAIIAANTDESTSTAAEREKQGGPAEACGAVH
ncbi:uncharacterized protein L3040_009400 [Drepanopeziza brunnea f. sp. 'multigermtubi']|uniref:Uncharacterized protein n=1 Tax=Marssonina brunnea f. sp. multigermtubi (strain MB_m1) TaxID=1072389 RepID=K1XHK2_MARBU|nr:uncharacterized protein MBM_09909 [Drepanopeziza brunnea f. sp. 'multigermtubi' MB_m1]EKD11939.1 hypothetical protein MBM_09909 [Drepanopeziza brunnea f. sp. 'multigermtubi' MB_m1]KAJ5032808.1 hypothetical protein L3040_009400 [Drepanopeziza brunnea f. sp. 'multigermtubi']